MPTENPKSPPYSKMKLQRCVMKEARKTERAKSHIPTKQRTLRFILNCKNNLYENCRTLKGIYRRLP